MIRTKKIKKYICLALFFAIALALLVCVINPVTALDYTYPDMNKIILSDAAVLMDGDTGQVLFEKNMREKMYPASITKIMTALLALENGKLSDIITMSYDAVFTVGRDTSHIALDHTEVITLEQALYALAIESANDAANGIAELISGTMLDFAGLMTKRAKELGAVNTNFSNAHGLPEKTHYTTAYDMARIMSAAIKLPEFSRIFSAVVYDMPSTNRQPEARQFNRKNSLVNGPYSYDGLLAEKTGWTGDAGYTYVAAAKRNGRTLVAVVMKSPDTTARWEDTTALFNYGFDNFISVSYKSEEFIKEKYIISNSENSGGINLDINLIPETNFNCLILNSMTKEDIDIKYIISTDGENNKTGETGEINGKAVFVLKQNPEIDLSNLMFNELGKVDLQVCFNKSEESAVNAANINSPNSIDTSNNNNKSEQNSQSLFLKILAVISVILQIIGGIAIIAVILYIRYYVITQKRKKRTRNKNYNRRNKNNYNNMYR